MVVAKMLLRQQVGGGLVNSRYMEKPNPDQERENSANLMPASEEILDVLAQAPRILEFKPSEKARARVWELVAREKEGTVTEEENHELDHYAQVEHILRLVKARARKLQPRR